MLNIPRHSRPSIAQHFSSSRALTQHAHPPPPPDSHLSPDTMSVTIHTTHGPLKLELFCDLVPRTCFNFLALAASGAYDGSLFHRLIPQFMIQGGAPAGKTKGGSSIWGEAFNDEFHPDLKHDRRGVVSMANKGPNTQRSQFFVTFERQPHLNNTYTVFGRVIDHLDTLDVMERSEVGEKDRPRQEIRIERVEIHANPLADEGVVYETKDGPPVVR
mmetsp:Transcript_10153/g.20208  ORF Transcript_10153/g.20208 Transcript_10153/m.20208 type:complete len:216 (+) Transcript_10153:465-1112(+)